MSKAEDDGADEAAMNAGLAAAQAHRQAMAKRIAELEQKIIACGEQDKYAPPAVVAEYSALVQGMLLRNQNGALTAIANGLGPLPELVAAMANAMQPLGAYAAGRLERESPAIMLPGLRRGS